MASSNVLKSQISIEKWPLKEWNETQNNYPQNKCIQELFEQQVEQTPEAIAVVLAEEQLTYQELNRKANQLASYLRDLGVEPDTLVGICLERSLDLVIGLLGILKAGGAYLPLDPSYPPERLAFMIEDSQCRVLLSNSEQQTNLPTHQTKVVCIDTDWSTIAQYSKENPDSGVTPDNLAYTIYTSGSTGKPKGVQIGHRALVNFLTSMSQAPGLSQEDILLAVTTISFDIAGLELYLPLLVGARVVLVTREVASDPTRLINVLEESGATVMQATPATWRMLLAVGWQGSSTLKILCGGEPMSKDLAAQLLERSSSVWNMYGPTETTVWSTIHRVESGNSPIPIGRPIANTQIYLVAPEQQEKEQLQLVPVGEPGELLIGGVGLARGYLNRPELNEEKFIPDPFSSEPGARLYRTGDLARYLPDGTIECLGRIDHQVKIRGFRIELGEIESTLVQHPSIAQTVVIAREDTPGDKRLVAYVVLNQNQTPTIQEFRSFLKEKLPSHMVPGAFVVLEALPLTPNCKVDRRALPAPDLTIQNSAETFVAPQDELTLQLAKIWEGILGIHPIGIKDNFFDLGGHSLLAIPLLTEIEKAFKKNLSLATLLQSPTIEQLANILRSQEDTAPESSIIPIQSSGSKPPFFFINSINYAKIIASYFGSDQPWYCLSIFGITGLFQNHLSQLRIADIAAKFIEDMRKIQPEGPYLLGTYCDDWKLTLEIAQQLNSQGQKVALLAFIDVVWDASNSGLSTYWHNLRKFGLYYFVSKVKNKLKFMRHRIIILTKSIKGKLDSKFGRTLTRKVQDVNFLEAFYQATDNYSPQAYPGQITLFLSSEWQFNKSPKFASIATEGLEEEEIYGYHHTIFEEPQVKVMAEKLSACIDKTLANK